MFDAIFGTRRAPAMGPAEVRALRDELGWTQEQLADAAGVSALEVSAWEAGAVTVLPAQAVALAWAAWRGRRERAWEAADARPCAWGAETRARLDRIGYDEPGELRRTARKLRVHVKRCAACARAKQVERALPAEPPELDPLSPLAALLYELPGTDRLPLPLRVLLRVARAAVWMLILGVVVEAYKFFTRPAGEYEPPPGELVAVLFAAFAGCVLADEVWDGVYAEHPWVGGFLKAATIAAPPTVLAVWWSSPWMLSIALPLVLLIGLYLGQQEAKAQEAEQRASLSGEAAPAAVPGPRVEPDLRPTPRETAHPGWYLP